MSAFDAAATVDEQIFVLQSYLSEIDTVFFFALSDLAALDAPPEVRTLHNDFLDVVEAAAQTGRDFSETLTSATTGAEVDQLTAEFDLEISQIVARGDDICLGLQGIADANGIDVDLDCED